MRPSTALPALLALCLSASLWMSANAGAASPSIERRSLQLRQQQDALNLELQQSIRSRRYDLGTADARRLDQLQLQQRLEQQQLEQQQIQRDNALRHSPAPHAHDALDARIASQREVFALERQLQMQRFDMEQRQLLQSAPRQPLQPPIGAGQLNLP